MWLVIAVVGAAILALVIADRPPAAATTTPVAAATPFTDGFNREESAQQALPPGHPPIGAGMSDTAPEGVAPDDEPPSITWTVPKDWRELPNTSAMRLATYRVSDALEMSVVRAGGSVDANVQRWTDQFDSGAKVAMKEKAVRGLHVTVVEILGNHRGAEEMGGTAGPARNAWAMRVAIVDASDTRFFFKVLGPGAEVERARAGFDALVESITPAAP
jgi:hypothetical protein